MQYSGFFDSINGDRRYNAEDFGRMFDGLITDGIVAGYGDAFSVSKGGGLNIVVGTGKAHYRQKWLLLTEPETITLKARDQIYDRWDAVCVEVDTSDQARRCRLVVVEGTPAASPKYPEPGNGDTQWYAIIAYVRVKKVSILGPYDINAEDIVDNRGSVGFPYVTGVAQSTPTDMIRAQSKAEFDKFMQELKTATLNPPNANAELAQVKSRVNTLEQAWSVPSMGPGVPTSASAKFPYIQNGTLTRVSSPQNMVYAIFDDIPAMHNAIYRGRNLGTTISEEHKQAIRTGSFKDLWLGDYWTRATWKYTIAAFDYWYGAANVNAKHTITILAERPVESLRYHSGSIIDQAITEVYQNAMVAYNINATATFGENAVIGRRVAFVRKLDGQGYPSEVGYVVSQITFPTAPMIFGTPGPTVVKNDITMANAEYNDNIQLPLLRIRPDLAFVGSTYWLHGIAGPNSAQYADASGGIDMGAPTVVRGIRPVFGIGYSA